MNAPYPAPPDVAGRSLSGSEPYVISAEENAALCRASGIEPAVDGSAHPAYAYIAGQVGMAITVAELCALCDFDIDLGPMITGSSFRFEQALMTGTPYCVSGEILSLTRKPSRAFGIMDLLEFELRLIGDDGALVASARNTWALPRRELVQ